MQPNHRTARTPCWHVMTSQSTWVRPRDREGDRVFAKLQPLQSCWLIGWETWHNEATITDPAAGLFRNRSSGCGFTTPPVVSTTGEKV